MTTLDSSLSSVGQTTCHYKAYSYVTLPYRSNPNWRLGVEGKTRTCVHFSARTYTRGSEIAIYSTSTHAPHLTLTGSYWPVGYGYDLTSFCFEGAFVIRISLRARPASTHCNCASFHPKTDTGLAVQSLLVPILACVPLTYNAIRQGWYTFFISGITT